jgi:xylan 1,4-beta-xylosidase
VPFHGGFGLLNIHGIAKPAYRAFELLHALGDRLLPTEGAHPTVDMWAVGGAQSVTVLLTNYGLPRHPIATETAQISLRTARAPTEVTIRRIDAGHANPKQRWLEMGAPEYLNAAVVAELNAASRCDPEPQPFAFKAGAVGFDVALPPLSVAAVTLRFSPLRNG